MRGRGDTDRHGRRAARDPETGKTVDVPGDWNYEKWYKERVSKNTLSQSVSVPNDSNDENDKKTLPDEQKTKKSVLFIAR